jgi:hypothetical protein
VPLAPPEPDDPPEFSPAFPSSSEPELSPEQAVEPVTARNEKTAVSALNERVGGRKLIG